jgi:hypothetical protein
VEGVGGTSGLPSGFRDSMVDVLISLLLLPEKGLIGTTESASDVSEGIVGVLRDVCNDEPGNKAVTCGDGEAGLLKSVVVVPGVVESEVSLTTCVLGMLGCSFEDYFSRRNSQLIGFNSGKNTSIETSNIPRSPRFRRRLKLEAA